MDIWNWLNQNAGGLTAVLTAVLAISTIVYTIASLKLVRTTAKTILEMQTTRRQMENPNVVIDFNTIRNGLHAFIVRNYGIGPALNVKIIFPCELKQSFALLNNSINHTNMFESLARGDIMLAPNQTIAYAICGPQEFGELLEVAIDGELSYSNIHGDTMAYKFNIIPKSQIGSLYHSNEIQEIGNNLLKINTTLENILKKVK